MKQIIPHCEDLNVFYKKNDRNKGNEINSEQRKRGRKKAKEQVEIEF